MTNEEANRIVYDFTRQTTGDCSSIIGPIVEANTFELKPTIVQMIQISSELWGIT